MQDYLNCQPSWHERTQYCKAMYPGFQFFRKQRDVSQRRGVDEVLTSMCMIMDLTFIVISIQLHHLFIENSTFSSWILHLILLQIVKPKRSFANPSPGIMLDPPALRTRERLPSP